MLLTLLLAAGCRGDGERERLCASLLPAFEPYPASVQMEKVDIERTNGREVTLEYLSRDRRGQVGRHWLVCGFRGGGVLGPPLTLTKVVTDRKGVLNTTQLQMLAIWQRLAAQPPAAGAGDAVGGGAARSPLYLLQQLINALVPACAYGLLAAAFSLIWGLIGRLNFALGDLTAVAGLCLLLGLPGAAAAGLPAGAATWLALLAFAIAAAAAIAFACDRYVFRPLAGASGQAGLIAAIGLAMTLREGLRLAHGERDLWLPPMVTQTWVLVRDGVTAVAVSGQQLALLCLAAACAVLLAGLLCGTRFGQRYRACCADRQMAALLGIDGGRIAAATFLLAGAAAAVAGLMITVYFGTINASAGFLLGFKGLVAALIGGLGSLPGALLGGFMVGVGEQLWSAYLDIAYRDVAVFGLLLAVLAVRPRGLFAAGDRGQPSAPR